MLAQILPGLRDIRAPLAAGYLWLVSLWLLFHRSIPSEASASGIVRALYELFDVVSLVGAGVAVSFVAYVIGALSLSVMRGIVFPLARLIVRWQYLANRLRVAIRYKMTIPGRGVRLRDIRVEDPPMKYLAIALAGRASERALWSLRSFVRQKTDDLAAKLKRSGLEIGDLFADYKTDFRVSGRDDPAEVVLEEVALDLPLVATRLIDTKADLYSEYDRLRSEAEFRYAISLPLAFLVGVVAAEASAWWILAGVGVILLFADGVRLGNDAGDVLAGAVRAEAAATGVLERLNQRVDDFTANRRDRGSTSSGESYGPTPDYTAFGTPLIERATGPIEVVEDAE